MPGSRRGRSATVLGQQALADSSADEAALKLWICCERDPPVVETVAALALIYDPFERGA